MPTNSAFGRLKQEEHMFETNKDVRGGRRKWGRDHSAQLLGRQISTASIGIGIETPPRSRGMTLNSFMQPTLPVQRAEVSMQ